MRCSPWPRRPDGGGPGRRGERAPTGGGAAPTGLRPGCGRSSPSGARWRPRRATTQPPTSHEAGAGPRLGRAHRRRPRRPSPGLRPAHTSAPQSGSTMAVIQNPARPDGRATHGAPPTHEPSNDRPGPPRPRPRVRRDRHRCRRLRTPRVAHGAAAQAISEGGNVVVAPGAYPVAPYAGWGWGWGFGNIFFGFFGFFIFLFLFFGLLRLAFGGGRGGWGRHGDYGRGPNGWTDGEARSWEDRARRGARRLASRPPGHARLADDRRPGRLTSDSPSLPFTAPGPDRDPAPPRP